MSGQSSALADALALLEGVIRGMEAERAAALPVLGRAKGVDAERLFKAIKLLDDKIFEAQSKRTQLVKRIKRAARLEEITNALHLIRAELEAGEAGPSRREQLRRQGADLQSEVSALVAESKQPLGSAS